MKIPAVLAAVLVGASFVPAARAEPVALDDGALAQTRAGLAIPISSIVQAVGFGGQTDYAGTPAEIAIGISDGTAARSVVLSETQSCVAASCNQALTHIAVGIVLNLPAAPHGF